MGWKGESKRHSLAARGINTTLSGEWGNMKNPMMYKNMNLFKVYLRNFDYFENYIKYKDGAADPDETKQIVGMQEGYLGYLPKYDVFITGWDVFKENTTDDPYWDDSCSLDGAIVYFKIDDDRKVKYTLPREIAEEHDIEVIEWGPKANFVAEHMNEGFNGLYSTHFGAYHELRKVFGDDLIDIRLD